MQFPDRSQEIKLHSNWAKEAEAKGDFDTARTHYFRWVESVRQQNVNTGGALEVELEDAKKAYADFVSKDPLYNKICNEILPYIGKNPNVLQTDLYKVFPQYSQENLRYTLYFAEEHGKVKREKKGRSYTLTLI